MLADAMKRSQHLCAALALAWAGAAGADTMYLIESRSDTLWAVDVDALEAELLGPLGVDWTSGGLGLALDGTVYGYNVADRGLYTIHPATGVATFVGADLEPHGLDGFEIHPMTGQALGLGADNEIWEIDLATGEATFVLEETRSNFNFGNAAFAPDGSLYVADWALDRLLTVDPVTGAVTVVGPFTLNASMASLAYRTGEDVLYALRDFDQADLLRIDPETGTAPLVGAVAGLPVGDVAYTAATFAPQTVFEDGFESGDTTAWSATVE